MCNVYKPGLTWKCAMCSHTNEYSQSDKICQKCQNFNSDSFWNYDQSVTLINKKSQSLSLSPTTKSPKSSLQTPSNGPKHGILVPFIDDDSKDDQITLILSKDNHFQHIHFEHFYEILSDLNSSNLCIDVECMKKHLDADNNYFVTSFIDITHEFAQYLIKNNKEILNEIKIAIEAQTYEPKGLIENALPIWTFLNDSVVGFFDETDKFLDLRDKFVLDLILITWKPQNLQIKESVLLDLKANIQNVQQREATMNDEMKESDLFIAFEKIMEVKPGLDHFKDILKNIPIAKGEWLSSHQKLEQKYKENNEKFVENYDELAEDFLLSLNAMEQDIREKKEKYNNLVLELGKIRSLLGINDDDVILEFLEKIEGLLPLSVRIHARNVQFEVLIGTLSELLVRLIDSNYDTESPPIDWYFMQPQIRLSEFIKPLQQKGIKNVNDFKKVYKGKIKLFEKELLPYLKKEIGRKIKKAEERRLRTICQAKG